MAALAMPAARTAAKSRARRRSLRRPAGAVSFSRSIQAAARPTIDGDKVGRSITIVPQTVATRALACGTSHGRETQGGDDGGGSGEGAARPMSAPRVQREETARRRRGRSGKKKRPAKSLSLPVTAPGRRPEPLRR
ncbi:MAG: hypothetical protein R3B70_03055 [Polyangiaceae bacterium]